MLALVGVGAGTAGAGCGGATPLQEYIADKGFAPLKVPRDKPGAGTLVRFDSDAGEIIVDPAEGGLCIGKAISEGTVTVQRGEARLEKIAYDLEEDSTLELSAARIIQDDLRLDAVFKDKRVQRVKIEFASPFQEYVPESFVKQYVSTQPAGSTCHDYLTADEGVFIIHMVLGAEGLSYSFYDENERAITIDAGLMDLVGAKAEIKSKYVGQTTLEVDGKTLFGVKVYQVVKRSGAAETVLVTRPVSADDLKDLIQR